jgi:hypothetical protein
MKKLMFVFAAMACSVVFVSAKVEAGSRTAQVSQATRQDEKVKIKADELPAAVKSTLKGQDYSGWMIDAAYKYTATETYEVVLKQGTETATFQFDKEGKKIE